MGSSIVIVHPDSALRATARATLELAGHTAHEAVATEGAWRLLETADVALLPWFGRRFVKETLARLPERPAFHQLRVLVWTARADLAEAVEALELGADDCFGVPFEPAELVARVNACLRRPAASAKPDRLTAGALVLDRAAHCLFVEGRAVVLAPAEFRLLAFFLENQRRVFSRDELLRRAWPKNIKAGQRTVDVHVRRLRQLLEPYNCGGMIQTVRGFGYRFAEPARGVGASRPLVLGPQDDRP